MKFMSTIFVTYTKNTSTSSLMSLFYVKGILESVQAWLDTIITYSCLRDVLNIMNCMLRGVGFHGFQFERMELSNFRNLATITK